jgi:DNA-binding response OmpR family regulator
METAYTILIAEEDAATRAFLADNLAADGYHVTAAQNQREALALLRAGQPDLVVCDVNGDTLGLLDAIRHADGVASRIDADVPLIVLTARADELARVRYLDHGCDDLVAKPFSYPELRARIRALLRRSQVRRSPPATRVGPLRIDHATREVRVGDTRVALTRVEYALLTHLAGDPARVFTKTELLRDVWGFRAMGRTRTIDSYACRLRRKLAEAGGGRFVENVWGVGYRLAPIDTREPEPSAA